MSKSEWPSIEDIVSPQDVIDNPQKYEPYARILHALRRRLIEGYPLPDDIEVAVIGNKSLLESTFLLREFDRNPIGKVINPGKSAHVSHTLDIRIACLTMLSRPAKREDHLYIVPSPLLRDIQFSPIYSPTRKHPLHVRLVPDRLDSEGDIPETYRRNLASLLQRYQIKPRIPLRS